MEIQTINQNGSQVALPDKERLTRAFWFAHGIQGTDATICIASEGNRLMDAPEWRQIKLLEDAMVFAGFQRGTEIDLFTFLGLIHNHFPWLRESELMLAFVLNAEHKWEKFSFDNILTGDTLTRVLSSYKTYRLDAIKKKTEADKPPEIPLTEEELIEKNQQAVVSAFERYKQDKNCLIPSAIFDGLWKAGIIKITKENVDRIKNLARQERSREVKVNADGNDNFKAAELVRFYVSGNLPKPEEDIIRAKAKVISLREYFDSLIQFDIDLKEKLK